MQWRLTRFGALCRRVCVCVFDTVCFRVLLCFVLLFLGASVVCASVQTNEDDATQCAVDFFNFLFLVSRVVLVASLVVCRFG